MWLWGRGFLRKEALWLKWPSELSCAKSIHMDALAQKHMACSCAGTLAQDVLVEEPASVDIA